MYICIDIGGTKTLVASLTDDGVISESQRFPTSKTYEEFRVELARVIESLSTRDFRAGTVAVPGTIDRKRDVIKSLGNLEWTNIHIARDIERITHCPMRVENDAKLGGLSEAMLLKDKYSKVLYITISTGIGIGLIENCVIDTEVGDGGGRTMLIEHKGKLMPWEDFASGSAIVKKYGKKAEEIHDSATWRHIVHNLSPGLIELIAVLDPEVIVIGGGAGQYLDRFYDLLINDIRQYETPMLHIPPIIGAQRPEEAVIYGCYDYAHQKYA